MVCGSRLLAASLLLALAAPAEGRRQAAQPVDLATTAAAAQAEERGDRKKKKMLPSLQLSAVRQNATSDAEDHQTSLLMEAAKVYINPMRILYKLGMNQETIAELKAGTCPSMLGPKTGTGQVEASRHGFGCKLGCQCKRSWMMSCDDGGGMCSSLLQLPAKPGPEGVPRACIQLAAGECVISSWVYLVALACVFLAIAVPVALLMSNKKSDDSDA